ncbi:MAG TPA: MBL fold metallo-hydrolase [Casimicrobiaceae bacterium]|nr:MBL fold metallo-hydrolase [Casimicrobiaceae bacterium]
MDAERNLAQLFDTESSTLTYLLFDRPGGAGVLIDPVDRMIERDLAEIARRGLTLAHVCETHVHADHVTSAASLREMTGASVIVPRDAGTRGADREVGDGDEVSFGAAQCIRVLATPGHTSAAASYLWNGCAFTGDTLFINGCGRTDFQGGDAGALYDSITQKLFALPDETIVYPAHDYNGRRSSMIGRERRENGRIANRSRDDFIALMGSLNLPMPKLIEVAVPANLRLGAVE